MRRRIVLTFLALAFGCSDGGPGGVVDPDPAPSGPAPVVEATAQFGDGPVEGAVYLLPGEGTSGWSYAVDLDEDGETDQEGVLDVEWVAFDYRFEEPGTHAIEVELTGPHGVETVSVPVVVDRPSAIRVIAETRVEPLDPDARVFEGIAASRDGSRVFAGDFTGGDVHALDAATLEPETVVELAQGVEGLTVSPSGDYLLAVFKYEGTVRLALPGVVLDLVREEYWWAGHYAHAVSDHTVLTGGRGDGLRFLDVFEDAPLAEQPRVRGHFDLSPAGDRVVGMDEQQDPAVIRIVTLPDLAMAHTHVLPPGSYPSRVAYGPSGNRIFALVQGGRDPLPDGWTLYVLDAESGTVERRISVDNGSCTILCAANPVARSREGRYVAFETGWGVLVVDVATGLPVARGPLGSVAASPTEDATFYALQPDGVLRKFVVEP